MRVHTHACRCTHTPHTHVLNKVSSFSVVRVCRLVSFLSEKQLLFKNSNYERINYNSNLSFKIFSQFSVFVKWRHSFLLEAGRTEKKHFFIWSPNTVFIIQMLFVPEVFCHNFFFASSSTRPFWRESIKEIHRKKKKRKIGYKFKTNTNNYIRLKLKLWLR